MNFLATTGILSFLTIVSLSSLALVITCLATPEWGYNPTTNFSTGLNSYCNGSNCQAYTKEEKVGALFATGFFVWTSIFTTFFGCVLPIFSFYYLFKHAEFEGTKTLCTILGIENALTGLFMLIAMSCFTGGYSGFQYGYSYFVGWAAFALCSFVSLLLLTSRLCMYISSRHDQFYE